MVLVPLIGIMLLALYTRRYVRGVSDHISAGRCAGRYLLTSSDAAASSGLTSTVGNVQRFMIIAFVGIFWDGLLTPLALLLAITGFVVYRYRQTRVLTLAQFFEERYSRSFRLFYGWVIFAAGGLGYIVFPLASCLFFKAFLGLPDYFQLWGMMLPTNAAIMATYLSVAVFMIWFGGQVTLMITDCVEGVFSHFAYLVIIFVIFSVVSWSQVSDVLCGIIPVGADAAAQAAMATAPDHSLVDPFDAFRLTDFNIYATMMGIIATIYLCGAWQGGHGFRSAARTPHEGRMAGILGAWRNYARTLMLVVIALGAITYLRHPDFTEKTVDLKAEIAAAPDPFGQPVPKVGDTNPVGSQPWVEGCRTVIAADGTVSHGQKLLGQDGKEIPQGTLERQVKQAPFTALSHMLPTGIKGLLLVVMIMGLFAGDGNHIISWSTVFVQDCILPWRKRPLTTRQHLLWLRLGAVGMALLGFIGAMLLPLTVSIWVWWAVTGAIFNGGAGAILIGGLYWRRGTVQAAWAAAVVGTILGLASVVLSNNWWNSMDLLLSWGYPPFVKGGFWLSFFVMLICVVIYVVISLLTCRKPFDLQSLLRRAEAHGESTISVATVGRKIPLAHRLMGIDEHFTRSDRWIAILVLYYSLLMTGLIAVMAFWRYVLPLALEKTGFPGAVVAVSLDKHTWANMWLVLGLIIPGVIAVVTLFWFAIGSFIDMRQFFKDSATRVREADDDGMIRHE